MDNKVYLLSKGLLTLGKDLSEVHSTEFDNSFILFFHAEWGIISIKSAKIGAIMNEKLMLKVCLKSTFVMCK